MCNQITTRYKQNKHQLHDSHKITNMKEKKTKNHLAQSQKLANKPV